MTKKFRSVVAVAGGIVAAVSFSSCAYDPYYGGGSVGTSYSSGYGGYSTSFFVSTGDPLWGYDPSCYSYYNYSRRCYYDPYLHGYYPYGYRPHAVYGVPHPYGWHSGVSHISPPHNISNHSIRNWDDRVGNYRKSNYGWSNNVRAAGNGGGRDFDQRSTPRSSPGNSNVRTSSTRPAHAPNSSSSQWSHEKSRGNPPARTSQPSYKPKSQGNGSNRNEGRGGLPSYYNKPVNTFHPESQQRARTMNQNTREPASRARSSVPEQRQVQKSQGRDNDKKSENRGQGDRSGWGPR